MNLRWSPLLDNCGEYWWRVTGPTCPKMQLLDCLDGCNQGMVQEIKPLDREFLAWHKCRSLLYLCASLYASAHAVAVSGCPSHVTCEVYFYTVADRASVFLLLFQCASSCQASYLPCFGNLVFKILLYLTGWDKVSHLWTSNTFLEITELVLWLWILIQLLCTKLSRNLESLYLRWLCLLSKHEEAPLLRSLCPWQLL